MYGSYHCSYTLSSKIHPKMLHTLRPHTPFCLEMEYKIVRNPRLQGIRRCAPHALQSGTSNYYVSACVGVDMTALLKLITLMNNSPWSDDHAVAL